ncbi:fimbrial protein [Yersinia intermedia]|uniref:fimbrial protein n=1 Tax=Yersinia intermedia TaxID=631 RepID=UPI001643DD20|nr:fimbrial protein [Yersinia intermedia]MDA5479333.1 fimbrial protein [Yersinia intermedia]
MKQYTIVLTLLFSGAISHSAHAVDAAMSFTGNLVEAPCVINNGGPITVAFGNVVTTQVDGTYKRMEVPYTLTCQATIPINMKISGTATSFTSAGTLQTSVSDLGIQLQLGSTPITLDTTWSFNPAGTKPALYAVPVKKPASTLAAQAFTASATMSIDYP